MSSPRTCPSGHPIGTEGPKGLCTILKCGAPPSKAAPGPKLTKQEKEAQKTALDRAGAKQEMEVAKAEHLARMQQLKVPQNLEGSAAESWADRKFIELLPLAVAEVEWALKYGSRAEREAARRQVLDSTGRARKESAAGGQSPIIIIDAQSLELPWKKKKETVEGEVVQSALPARGEGT